MTQPDLTLYSENGCLLCREAEGTLRILWGDARFDQHIRIVKMTFDTKMQADFAEKTGSATIPKLYQGNYDNNSVAKDYNEIMNLIATGIICDWVGLPRITYPDVEEADALILGGGPAGILAYVKLNELGYKPLIITEAIGGKLVTAKALPDHNNKSGLDVFRKLLSDVPNVMDRLRPGVEIQTLERSGDRRILKSDNREYRTTGPLVLASGTSVQHFELQTELDFLDQGLTYSASWTTFRNGRVTIYASRNQVVQAYNAAQRMSRQNNDVTLISPTTLDAAMQTTLESTFQVQIVQGRVNEVITEGHPPQIVAVKSGDDTYPTDLLIWNEPFRSRGKNLYKTAFGTEWLVTNDKGGVMDGSGKRVPDVYGVGDAVEGSDKRFAAVLESVKRLSIPSK